MSSLAAKKHLSLLSRITAGLTILGALLFLSGAVLLGLIYFPVVSEEVRYAVSSPPKNTIQTITPVDREFGIVIPKIGANTKVIPNVNPVNPREYQIALTHGVAHARGSALPNQTGNIFIFAHSAGNFYEANQFNAVFYLLDKLKKDDEIYLFYQKNKFKYKVSEKKLVDATAVNFLSRNGPDKTLTLMTCWPPGTTLKRLLVKATLE